MAARLAEIDDAAILTIEYGRSMPPPKKISLHSILSKYSSTVRLSFTAARGMFISHSYELTSRRADPYRRRPRPSNAIIPGERNTHMRQRLLATPVVVTVLAACFVIPVPAYLAAGDTGLLAAIAAVSLVMLVFVAALALGAQDRRHAEHLVNRRLDRIDEELRAVRDRVNKRATELKRRVDPLRDDIRRATLRMDSRIGQIDHVIGLYYDLRPKASFPGTGGWAASPDLLRYLYDDITANGRSRILECGSGASTVIMAYALRELGHGRVVALDHDAVFAEQTREALKRHGLTDWAEVRVADLTDVEVAGETLPWYDPTQVPEGPFDLLLVDGPPKATGPQARFPAVPLLYSRLSPNAAIVLDDHEREDERLAGERWLDMFPDLTGESVGHHKNTLVLHRG